VILDFWRGREGEWEGFGGMRLMEKIEIVQFF